MNTTAAQVPIDQPLYGATFGQAIVRFYRKYGVLAGRASRSEFWWSALFLVVVLGVPYATIVTISVTSRDEALKTALGISMAVYLGIAGLGSLIPCIAIQVRRLHDAGYSGVFWFLHAIPWVGDIVVLILNAMPSSPLGDRFDRPTAGSAPATAGIPAE